MRRPPEVGQAGLVVILLLGASGCAGFPQRTIGTSPGSAPADGQSVSPPGLFSWWHRGSSQNVAEETASVSEPDTAKPGPRYPLANQPTNPWPESQSEWVARNFPRFNRLWNGSTTGSAREAGDDLSTSRTPSSRPADDTSVTASVPRSDSAVRPTEGSSSDDTSSNADRSGARVQNLDDLPFSPTPPPVRSPRQSTPEPVTAPSSVNDERTVPIPSDVTESAERAALKPKADPVKQPQQPPKEIEPDSAVDRASSQPQALDDILPAPAIAGPQASANGDAGTNGPAGSKAATGLDPVPVPESATQPTPDTRLAQAPPPPGQQTAPAPPPPGQQTAPAPPPPGQRTPAAPSPAPATSPPEPPAPQAAAPAEGAKPAAADPTPALTPAPPAATAPAPATGQAQSPALVSGQRPLAASGQSTYSSPSHIAQPKPRHHLLSRLFHDDDNAPLASSQLPVAAFPSTYMSPQNVLATTQGNAGACETADKAPKKPCFLKVWIHDWKNGHGPDGDGCGHGGVCASPQSNGAPCDTTKAPKKPCFLKVWIHDWKNGKDCSHGDGCGHNGVTASPQAPTVCETAATAPKKPCFLKVWIHDWKSGHGSGCGSCQKDGGSCCQSGKCCGGGGSPVSASGQGNIAAAQATGQVYTRP